MKTRIITLSLAVLSILATGTTLSTNAKSLDKSASSKEASISDLTVLQVKPMQFRVSFVTKQSRKVSVRIVDADKNVLYSENSNVPANYMKYFDLTPLLDGTYSFEVVDGKEKYSQSFNILTQTQRIVSVRN
jgi:hypothetical protein